MEQSFWDYIFYGRESSETNKPAQPAPSFSDQLTPGMRVKLQYDNQPPTYGTFQGMENENVLLTDFPPYHGLVRIARESINAIAPAPYTKERRPKVNYSRPTLYI